MIIININTQQQDEQVWMPPLTAITGNGDPNGNPGGETIFIAMATTANSFSNYQDFDNSLATADTLVYNYYNGDGVGYCNPPGKEVDGYAYESWDGLSTTTDLRDTVIGSPAATHRVAGITTPTRARGRKTGRSYRGCVGTATASTSTNGKPCKVKDIVK